MFRQENVIIGQFVFALMTAGPSYHGAAWTAVDDLQGFSHSCTPQHL
jgi:hypothetical protein